LALDYVLARLAEVMTPEQCQVWLTSPNPALAGARPVDVVVARGPLAVDDAIAAFEDNAPV
ncbi:MAG TPA: antitoxin Xre/MbcA/ParS toxin-binding domain-containing protein, partial [Acidimicrobiales bacterium]|nr:antitoxin Xre/MbcA/ParS toxin-binding domain-containing protein [Acidimicrobiales bacterium]